MSQDSPGMTDEEIRKLSRETWEHIRNEFNAKLGGLESKLEARLDAGDKAMEIYAENMKLNMEHLNRVRIEVLEDRGNFVSLELFRAEQQSLKNTLFAVIGWILLVAGVVATVIVMATK